MKRTSSPKPAYKDRMNDEINEGSFKRHQRSNSMEKKEQKDHKEIEDKENDQLNANKNIEQNAQ